MELSDLTPQQAHALAERLMPALGYLTRQGNPGASKPSSNDPRPWEPGGGVREGN